MKDCPVFFFPSPPLFFFSIFLHTPSPLLHPPFSPGSRISVQKLLSGASTTTMTLAFLNSVSSGDSHCTYSLNQSCLSASSSRSSKFLLFLNFTSLVLPKRVWNPRANGLKTHSVFRLAFPWQMPRQTLNKIPTPCKHKVLLSCPVTLTYKMKEDYYKSQISWRLSHSCGTCGNILLPLSRKEPLRSRRQIP